MAVAGSMYFMSCSSKPREKGTPIESTSAAVKAVLDNKKANDGKRFAVTGYLHYSPGFAVYTNRPQTVYVCPEPGEAGKSIATIDMQWKHEGHNSVFVPDEAGRDATKTIFYDNEGKALSGKDKVTVSFGVSENSASLIEPRVDKAQ